MPDPAQAKFVAELLRAEAPRLAADAARRLIDRRPDLAHRYGPLPSHKWRDCFRARIDDLAAALDARCPDLLGAQLAWARCAFAARDVPAEDLSAGCEALREAIGAAVAPEDRALIESYFARALEQAGRASGAVPGALAPDAPHGCLAARYLLALLEGDRRRALALVRDALAAGVPTRELHIHVFAPVLREVGRMWLLGEITVAEEHFATSTTRDALAEAAAATPRAADAGRTLLCACVEGNRHDLGARMLADWFEFDGWRVIDLGADTPAADLAAEVADFAPHLVALSACTCGDLAAAEEAIRTIRESRPGAAPPIIVGGQAFDLAPAAWRNIGADAHAPDPAAAAAVARRLLDRARA